MLIQWVSGWGNTTNDTSFHQLYLLLPSLGFLEVTSLTIKPVFHFCHLKALLFPAWSRRNVQNPLLLSHILRVFYCKHWSVACSWKKAVVLLSRLPSSSRGSRITATLKMGCLQGTPEGESCNMLSSSSRGLLGPFPTQHNCRTSLATLFCPYVNGPNQLQTATVHHIYMQNGTWPYELSWFSRLEQWTWTTGLALKILPVDGLVFDVPDHVWETVFSYQSMKPVIVWII